MNSTDDFRFRSHQLLLELDAATNHIMMLVSARQVSGYAWEEAASRQKLAYEAWAAFLYAPSPSPSPSPETDPIPSLDGRPAGKLWTLTD
ncbi:hypothetical protein [Pseudomonas arsenicoxydans]|uniref:hypothetical protein n=1 Tax=Pseudomonas arsenicoxydans TaxID=702115 RepID=UPI000B7CD510|nr:hypothetical protein [Pseudomonas arsenicoxydans]